MTARGLFDLIEKAVSLLSSVVLISVMCIVSVDVFMRYALNSPLRWSYDSISLYALVAVFYFSVSRAYRENYHLRLDVLYNRFPAGMQTLVNIFGLVITLPLILWLAWINGEEALRAYRLGLAQSGRFAWPTWPVRAIVSTGFGLLGIRMMLDLIRNGADLLPRRAPGGAGRP